MLPSVLRDNEPVNGEQQRSVAAAMGSALAAADMVQELVREILAMANLFLSKADCLNV